MLRNDLSKKTIEINKKGKRKQNNDTKFTEKIAFHKIDEK